MIEKEGLAAGEAKFKELRAQADRYSFVERDFNLLGYRYLQAEVPCPRRSPIFPTEYRALSGIVQLATTAWGRPMWPPGMRPNPGPIISAGRGRRPQCHRQREGRPRHLRFAVSEPRMSGKKHTGPVSRPGSKDRVTKRLRNSQLFAPGVVYSWRPAGPTRHFSPDGERCATPSENRSANDHVLPGDGRGMDGPRSRVFSAWIQRPRRPFLTLDNRQVYWGWFRPILRRTEPPADGLRHLVR
ncbi:MAG: hypothetical protein MZV63_46825 [Marinilabiliales bacterium]|nr:hypothetical protein [Marinilabiliales bacterium]